MNHTALATEQPGPVEREEPSQSHERFFRVAGETPIDSTVRPRQSSATALRWFYKGRRVGSRFERMISAIYAGFWLGYFDDVQINAVVGRLYEENDLYRTAAHNMQGLFDWETKLLHEHFSECRSIVVGAAGGGREMIGLARAGWKVDAFECNPELAEKCREFLRQAGVAGQILNANPDEVPSSLETYEGAIVGCGALGHITGRSKRVKFLRALKSHLTPGAPLMLSVGRRPEGSHYHNWIYQIARTVRLLSRTRNSLELGDDPLDCYTHRFTEAEIHSELREAGFEVTTSVETQEIYVVAHA